MPSLRLVDQLTDTQSEQLHALYQKEWWSVGRTLSDTREVLRTSSFVLGLVEDDSQRLVAFCRLLTDFLYHATVYDVIVTADYRGQGLGRRLMDAVVAHPRLHRVNCLWLSCLPELISFYQQWGFETVENEVKWLRRLHVRTQ